MEKKNLLLFRLIDGPDSAEKPLLETQLVPLDLFLVYNQTYCDQGWSCGTDERSLPVLLDAMDAEEQRATVARILVRQGFRHVLHFACGTDTHDKKIAWLTGIIRKRPLGGPIPC